jgi:hypothetical protein
MDAQTPSYNLIGCTNRSRCASTTSPFQRTIPKNQYALTQYGLKETPGQNDDEELDPNQSKFKPLSLRPFLTGIIMLHKLLSFFRIYDDIRVIMTYL